MRVGMVPVTVPSPVATDLPDRGEPPSLIGISVHSPRELREITRFPEVPSGKLKRKPTEGCP